MKSARISTDLGDPRLIKLLKHEADQTDSSIKQVLVNALESYFAHRLETRAMMKISEEVFNDWNDPLDSDYDHIKND